MSLSLPDAEPASSEDLAVTIAAQPVPLLFLDTAAILDVSRVPHREELQADILKVAVDIIDELAATPQRIWVVTTANVMQEFGANRESTVQELEKRISEMNRSLLRLSQIARSMFPDRRIANVEWLDVSLNERIVGVMDRLVTSMSVYRGTTQCVGRARERLWAGRPPASRAKQQFKDCEIFEEFIELMMILRAKGFDQRAVFVTPNSQDYGPPPDGFEQIGSDLKAVQALYAANIAWARGIVNDNKNKADELA